MAESEKTIVVTINETKLVNHYGDSFELTEGGHLMIYKDEELIASYAPGNWKSVMILE